jgi:hypothetical protein
MENITTIVDSEGREHIQIEMAEGYFLSMPKAEYDRRQAEAEQSTPIVVDEAETK